MGYELQASASSELIEIKRNGNLQVGTTIEVEIDAESVKSLDLDEQQYSGPVALDALINWFCWDWPRIVKRVIRGAEVKELRQGFACPIRKTELPPEWSVIHPAGFDEVHWTFGDAPRFSCNGLMIVRPGSGGTGCDFEWPGGTELDAPRLAVVDSKANLPLTIQRYELSHEDLPFCGELARDVVLSFIAHALVCGPISCELASSLEEGHPLRVGHFSPGVRPQDRPLFSDGRLRWCMTTGELVPVDPWLYTLLNASSCLICGSLSQEGTRRESYLSDKEGFFGSARKSGCAIVFWASGLGSSMHRLDETAAYVARLAPKTLAALPREGVAALGHEVIAARALFSVSTGFRAEVHEGAPGPRFPIEEVWKERHWRNPERLCYEANTGSLSMSTSLEAVLENMEATPPGQLRSRKDVQEVLFVAEIRTKKMERSPESLIAQIWNECLGARAIPFDPAARDALIADGCKHAELKRHIEAWQKMKGAGSKWATGEWARRHW